MKKLLASLAFALLPLLVAAQELSSDDLKRGVEQLEKTQQAFLKSTAGLSEAQLAFKPAPERWSVAEVSEHIAAAEDFLRDLVEKQVLHAPARTEPVDVSEIDAFVLKAIPDRTNKVKAPEPLIPTKRFGSFKATLEHFQESRAKTLALLKNTKDLRAHAVDSPLGKKLDAYQWLLFIAAHSERHTKQIEEVKADPAFPKS